MSRWTQTPGQSKPMCEAMKRPAQELGLLSRSWGDGRSDGVGEGLHPERPQGCCCSALSEHAGPRPAPAPSATAFLGICRKAVVGEGQCPLGTQLRGTWDPEGLARGLTGLPSPRRAAGKGAEGSRQTPQVGRNPGAWSGGHAGTAAPRPRGHLPRHGSGASWGTLLCTAAVSGVTLNPGGQSSACPPPDPPPPSSSCRPQLR